MSVDINQLHELFMTGKKIVDIAKELGVPYGTCRTIIWSERKKEPYKWPIRHNLIDNQPPLFMHLYECTDCFCKFAVEDYEDVDQSIIECPHCHNDESIEDAGYGYFTKTKAAESACS